MNNTIKFSVDSKNSGKRLDIFLSDNLSQFTRSFLKKLIENRQVMLNNKISLSPSAKVKYKDQIIANIIEKNKKEINPKKIDLNIIYEDKSILVIDKPKGMVVHPGAGNYENTLVNALIYKYKKNLSDINGLLRPGIVHRIDKETSGLLVVAKNNFAHSNLGDQFRNNYNSKGILILSASSDGKDTFMCAMTDSAISSFDAINLCKQIGTKINGGGGGKPHLATAGGKHNLKTDEIFDFIYNHIKSEIMKGNND